MKPNAATPTINPSAEVRRQVDDATDPEVPAGAREPRQRELEAEEEEQEDDPELGDEVRHLRGLNQSELLRLVRPEEQTCEQVGGDRREPESTRDQAEHREQADRERRAR